MMSKIDYWNFIVMVCKMVTGRGYWLSLESWGFFSWIYISNRKISLMDLWNIISFVMLINFDIYWNFVYHYHDNFSLVMPVNTRKMADLKDEILSSIDDKFSEFNIDNLAELKLQLKIEIAVVFKNELKKKGRVRVNSFIASATC